MILLLMRPISKRRIWQEWLLLLSLDLFARSLSGSNVVLFCQNKNNRYPVLRKLVHFSELNCCTLQNALAHQDGLMIVHQK